MSTIPEWANEKQREGMANFLVVLGEYGFFIDCEFVESKFEDDEHDSRFTANLEWGVESKGFRRHSIEICFDFESTWSHTGEQVHQWQFVFGDGEIGREMTSEILFVDLFSYLDRVAIVPSENN